MKQFGCVPALLEWATSNGATLHPAVQVYDDPTTGEDPPYGAWISYHLKTAHPAGSAPAVTIADASGAVVRRLTGTGAAETAQTRESSGQARFVSRDELRYSLRSVHLFAPWVRRIHLVTAGQVRAADGAAKQHVAHESKALLGLNEHHATGRMARAMKHREHDLAHAHCVALV